MGAIKRVQAFWAKFSNDWCMNLSGLLAYNFLTSIFPLLLAILAIAGLILPANIIFGIATRLNSFIAAGAASGGANGMNIDFNTIVQGFRRASGITLIISLAGLIWTGTNLFGCMENCFSIVFRTRDRNFIQQKLMGLVMICFFIILVPLSVFSSTISGSFNSITSSLGNVPGLGFVFGIGGYLIGVCFAFVLFFAIYIIVPNMPINPRDAWRGAIVAAVLFEIVNLVFPFYVKHQHSQFGAFAGLLAILTFWFWVVSLILLIGAEINSFAALGQRAAGGDLPTVMHNVAVHGRVPRAGEDADAPPAGHSISQRGERIHTGDRKGAVTTEQAAHPPGDKQPLPAGGPANDGRQDGSAPARSGKERAAPARSGKDQGKAADAGQSDHRAAFKASDDDGRTLVPVAPPSRATVRYHAAQDGRVRAERTTSQGSEHGGALVALFAGLAAVLAALHEVGRRRV